MRWAVIGGFSEERQDSRANLRRGLQETKHAMVVVMGIWTRIIRKHLQKSLKFPPSPRNSLYKNRKSCIELIRNCGRYLGIQCHLYKIPAKWVSHCPTPVQWPHTGLGKWANSLVPNSSCRKINITWVNESSLLKFATNERTSSAPSKHLDAAWWASNPSGNIWVPAKRENCVASKYDFAKLLQ